MPTRYHAAIGCLLAVMLTGCIHTGSTPEADDAQANGPDIEQIQQERDNVVVYTADGFEPQELTVSQGEEVTWVSTGPEMWVASNQHPAHNEYPEFDQLETGEMYTFQFDEPGEWDYHNHVNDRDGGTIIVEE